MIEKKKNSLAAVSLSIILWGVIDVTLVVA